MFTAASLFRLFLVSGSVFDVCPLWTFLRAFTGILLPLSCPIAGLRCIGSCSRCSATYSGTGRAYLLPVAFCVAHTSPSGSTFPGTASPEKEHPKTTRKASKLPGTLCL